MPALGQTVDISPAGSARPLGNALVDLFYVLGVRLSFGVTGGPIARFVHGLEDHEGVRWIPTRTENGGVLAAIGAARLSGRPVAVAVTSGPGLLATRQGLEIARRDGLRAVVVSPRTPALQRGRHVPQDGMLTADFLLPGQVFDSVTILESVEELHPLAAELNAGLSRSGGYLAHVVVPSDLLAAPVEEPLLPRLRGGRVSARTPAVAEVVELMARHRFFMVVGRGAHEDAELVRLLADLTGAPVVCTPGAKGVVDERGANSLGVAGIGGHPAAIARLREYGPAFALVLGSRLSGASVTADLVRLAPLGLVQVDRDAAAMGPAWAVETLAIQSELRPFLESALALGDRLVRRPAPPGASVVPVPRPASPAPSGRVRPRSLMAAIQEEVVDGSDAPVLVDVGTAWAWATSCLAFSAPRRFHLETFVGSMGLGAAGAVGAAIARNDKVVAITGDWSFDMVLPEVRTAVDHDAPVVWVVLQNSGGQMVVDGDRETLGRTTSSATFRAGDLAGAVRALGAGAACVTAEEDIASVIRAAMASAGPFLVEVWVDTSEMPPYSDRFRSLRAAGSGR